MMNQEKLKETEKILDEVSQRVADAEKIKNIPLFESYVCLYSIFISILLINFPSMLDVVVLKPTGEEVMIFSLLLAIGNHISYAVLFFVGGVLKGFGLLTNNQLLRKIGLIFSVGLYSLFTLALSFSAPSFLFLSFLIMAIFSGVSINMVKSTSIALKPEKDFKDTVNKKIRSNIKNDNPYKYDK